MKKLRWLGRMATGLSLGLSAPIHAQSDFDFTGPDKELAGDPTRVLVQGSPHISQLHAEALP